MSEAWSEDPEAFEEHFGLSYGDFHILLQALPPEVRKKYDKTLAVDEEAGIIFAIHKGRKLDLLKDDEPELMPEGGYKRGMAEMRAMPFRVFEHGENGWYFALSAPTQKKAIADADENRPFAVQDVKSGRIVYQENTESLPAVPYRLLSRPGGSAR
jgi:hypothetical protein